MVKKTFTLDERLSYSPYSRFATLIRELYFQQVDFPLGQTQRLRDKVHQQVNIPNGYFMFLSRLQGNKTDVLKHLVNMIGSYIRTNQFLLFSCLLAPEFYLDMRT